MVLFSFTNLSENYEDFAKEWKDSNSTKNFLFYLEKVKIIDFKTYLYLNIARTISDDDIDIYLDEIREIIPKITRIIKPAVRMLQEKRILSARRYSGTKQISNLKKYALFLSPILNGILLGFLELYIICL